MKTRKIKAFTLSELLVVLVITSIVVSLTFLTLRLVQKQITSIQTNFNDQQEIQFLERALLQDINTYNAYYDSKNDVLKLSHGKDSIHYEFTDNYIVRKKDTFQLKLVDKRFLIDTKEVKTGWIDALQFTFNQSYSTKNIFIYKIKDAAHYMNH